MPSQNLEQVYTANPITTLGSTDLIYVAQGGTTDAGMSGASFISQFSSPLTTKGDLFGFSTVNARVPAVTGDGKILQISSGSSVGVAYSTPTYPSASGASGKFLISDGTNNIYSTSTIPSSAGATANKLLLSNGTNYALSTPTFPNASATSRKIIVSDGTNWTASTETYAVPGTSGHVMTSDGTNWISSAPSGGSAAGSSQDIQFNSGGAFAADTGNFGWISATHSLYAGSSAEVSAGVQCGFALGLSATVLANHGIALGYGSTVESPWGFASGYNAQSNYQGSYVFADSTNSGKSDTANNQWVTCFTGGYYNWVGATLATKIDTNSNFINNKGTADQSKSVQTPSTGFSITIGAGIKTLMLTPSGTLTTGTITMPASPIDGQEIRVCSTQIVTSLTVSANAGQSITGAPTTITATGGFMYLYNLASTTWVRLY